MQPLLLRTLMCALLGLCTIHAYAQSTYQDALAIYNFRKQLQDYYELAGSNQPLIQPPSGAQKQVSINNVSPRIQPVIESVVAAQLAALAANAPADQNYTRPIGTALRPSTSRIVTAFADTAMIEQQVVEEFYALEQYVRGQDGNAHTSNLMETGAQGSDQLPEEFQYLPMINQQFSAQNASLTRANATSGSIGLVSGGLPEAQIIQGIVDWTVQRAKEELMRAFLQNWLNKLENDAILKAAFPKTLDLLATTDLTTLISQGDVWKSAFRQDLEDIPAHLPAIVRAILARVPATRLDANTRLQIEGTVEVASGLYVQLQQKKNIVDAIGTESATIMSQDRPTYSYAARGVVAVEIFISSVQIVEAGLPRIVTPQAILQLSQGQLQELWNLMYVRNQTRMKVAFNIQDTTAFYNKVNNALAKVQLALADVASILNTIAQLGASKNLDGTPVQDATVYFDLIVQLMEEGLELGQLLGIHDQNAQHLLENFVKPLGDDIGAIAEGVASKHYGLVVTNLISVLRLLGNELINDPKVTAILDASADGIALMDHLRQDLKTQTNPDTLIKDVKASLLQFKQQIDSIDGGRLAQEIDSLIKEVEAIVSTDIQKVRSAVDRLLKKTANSIGKWAEELNVGEGLEEIAEWVNTYGRFMVNVLTAETSADVQEAFEDAAMKTGSYMVKQTSVTSATLTFFPGYTFGREIAQAPGNTGLGTSLPAPSNASYMGATLPIGIELAIGIKSRVIGAAGLFLQMADLGAVLNYRLTATSDSLGPDSMEVKYSTAISPEIGFRQVLSPGLAIVLHTAKAPIAFGARVSYTPMLREVQSDGQPLLQANMLQIGAFVAVDITVLQLFASRKKLNTDWKRINE